MLVLGFADSGLRLATIESLIQTVLVLSIVLLAGYVGQVTLAELTFAGFAAFMLAKFAGEAGLPFPLSPLLAIAVTTIVATAISVPAVRIRGIQLAIVTVAAATAIEEVLFRSPDFTGVGGMSTVPRPRLFGLNLGILPEGRGGGYPNRAFGFFVLDRHGGECADGRQHPSLTRSGAGCWPCGPTSAPPRPAASTCPARS